MPDTDGLRKDILEKAHKSRMTIHAEGTKMYKDLKNELLVGRYEERSRRIRGQVPHLSES